MTEKEKEVIQAGLDAEKQVLKELEKQYKEALKAIEERIKLLETDDMTTSQIYQKQYQEALKAQIEGVLETLHGKEYTTIQAFLEDSYSRGFLGTMYQVADQGIPLLVPMDPAAMLKAVVLDSKLSAELYEALGVDVSKLKKAVQQEISRGISTNMGYNEIMRNITAKAEIPMNRARTIVRTESHRIQEAATEDGRQAAKGRGCDVVKQWDSTLDGATRPAHVQLDGQSRETDEPFEIGAMKGMYPGGFGVAAMDCNCRCVALTRARWAMDEEELKTMRERAQFFGVDKTENFEDFRKKYLEAVSQGNQVSGKYCAKCRNVLYYAHEERIVFGFL